MASNRSMPSAELSELFRRLSISLGAGLDPVRGWSSEAGRVASRWRPAVAAVADALRAGEGVADALERAGAAFPPEVRAIVAAGDRTGRDVEVFRDLAESQRRVAFAMRRLRSGLVRPLLQLVAAMAAVGVLILASDRAKGVDLLGLGLSGVGGLKIYAAGIAAAAAALVVVARMCEGSWRRRGLLRRWLMRCPGIGEIAYAWELSSWCRVAALSSAVGLDAGRLVRLASAAAPSLACDDARVADRLRKGATLGEAVDAEGILRGRNGLRVRAAFDVGEAAGSTAESLERISAQLFDEASEGLASLATWAGHAVWAVVAVAAAAIVIRVVSTYAGMLKGLV